MIVQKLAIARLMLDRFRGRTDRILVDDDCGPPRSQEPDCPLTAEMLAKEHLTHSTGYGVYPLLDDGCVYFAAIDFDDKKEEKQDLIRNQVVRVCKSLREGGLKPLVEVSQSGTGYHVWLFFVKPVKAALVRLFLNGALDQLGLGGLEVFPKQDEVTELKKYGNAIRLPLYNKSHFVDVEDGWRTIAPFKALRGVVKLTNQQLIQAATALRIDLPSPRPKPLSSKLSLSACGLSPYVQQLLSDDGSILARRWRCETTNLKDESKSGIAMFIATCLVRAYVPSPDIEITLRRWCAENCPKKGERDDWIELTIDKAYAVVQRGWLTWRETHRSQLAPDGVSLLLAGEFMSAGRRGRK